MLIKIERYKKKTPQSCPWGVVEVIDSNLKVYHIRYLPPAHLRLAAIYLYEISCPLALIFYR